MVSITIALALAAATPPPVVACGGTDTQELALPKRFRGVSGRVSGGGAPGPFLMRLMLSDAGGNHSAGVYTGGRPGGGDAGGGYFARLGQWSVGDVEIRDESTAGGILVPVDEFAFQLNLRPGNRLQMRLDWVEDGTAKSREDMIALKPMKLTRFLFACTQRGFELKGLSFGRGKPR